MTEKKTQETAEKKVQKVAEPVDVSAFLNRKLSVVNTKSGAKYESLATRLVANKRKGVK